MKNYKKVSIALLAIAALALGLVLAGCDSTYEGPVSGKTVTITLSSTTYKVEYEGRTATGPATHTDATLLTYERWDGTGTDWFWATVDGGKLRSFSFQEGGAIGSGWAVSGTNVNLPKKSLEGNVVSLDDVELIIIKE